MVAFTLAVTLQLAGYALGAVGGVLLFVELFQLPSYISYRESFNSYNISISPQDAREYTWAGRVGALLVALAFALQFVATLL